jgi:hypothetical protein
MSAVKTLAVMPILAFAFACSRANSSRDTALNEQLRSDLNRAAAPTADLAATRFRPDQAVSGVELGDGATALALARHHAAPPEKRADHLVSATPTPSLTAAKLVALAPAPQPRVAPATTAPLAFAYVPRPVLSAPNQAGGGFGHTLGVIIRGGLLGDDDHCQTHGPGMGRGGIFINVRAPMQPGARGPRGIW